MTELLFDITEYHIDVEVDKILISLLERESRIKVSFTYKYKNFVKWDNAELHKELEKDLDKHMKKLDKIKKDKDDNKAEEESQEWIIGQTVRIDVDDT